MRGVWWWWALACERLGVAHKDLGKYVSVSGFLAWAHRRLRRAPRPSHAGVAITIRRKQLFVCGVVMMSGLGLVGALGGF